MPSSTQKDLSLKWLELFQICARKGSLQAVADETGLSISTISHHLRNLENHLGVELFNHARRPLILTAKGRAFLANIEDALLAIRRAKAEASAGDIVEASHLRIGSIEDFDSDILPELAVFLSRSMTRCSFVYQSGSSTAIIDLLRNRQLDLGITASMTERLTDLHAIPLLQDPFVVVVPQARNDDLAQIVKGKTDLPLLRFSSHLIIGRQIEAHLRRSGISSPHRFECDNNQTLMAMVAGGAGWTITTPLLFARAKSFHASLKMRAFPGKSFSRTVSVIATPDCSSAVLDLVDQKMRDLIITHSIEPLRNTEPWLADSFRLLD